MIEKIFSGLAIAFVTGIGALAIRHHDIYSKIVDKIFLISFAIFLSINAYGYGYNIAISKVQNHILEISKGTPINTELFKIDNSSTNMVSLCIIAFVVYLIIMFAIGSMIYKKENQNIK